jgi:L-ascorbate metabolism protein UlaG (beta-lactamase superfamily)
MKTAYYVKASTIYIIVLLIICFPVAMCLGDGVKICYEKDAEINLIGDAQVELVSSTGMRILIDVANPNSLIAKPTERDILLSTHKHYDHFSYPFADAFPGKQLQMQRGEIHVPGVDIKGIVASHSDAPPSKDGYGTDYIYIIDIEGLRIVHFGDMEQAALTPEQLVELQNIDVAFAEFWAEPTNKFFNVMDQVKPRIIIPTHLGDRRALKIATEKWPSFQMSEKEVIIRKENLPDKTTFLVLGDWVKVYEESLALPKWNRE